MAWMAPTRRQVTLTLSAVYLAALTVLAAFALHHSHVYSLPIPDIVCALALALPPLAGVGLETVLSLDSHLARKGQVHASRIFQATVAAFLIYETVVATLAGVYVSPFGGMECALKDRWAALRSAKDADSIRKIQDAFNCCGLMSTKDMAWPFPEKAHPEANRCMVRFDRTQACIEPWRAEEQRVATMLMIVPIAVFLWKASSLFRCILVILAPSSTSTWLPSAIRLPQEDPSTAGRPRQAIGYREADGDEDSVRAEVNRLNKDSNTASQVEGERRRPSGHSHFREHDYWRNTTDDA
ncbi:hypothetical protein D0867_15977 [Hortaea werneckii]|uniref:Tetraspanin Tsp3 n=2 Tax=Hortaea werneckii TaxID=91943 RepID=A0A3M6X172_HORWE|nr:hypothetical protein D0867_15977 [Hortaea werneckii]